MRALAILAMLIWFAPAGLWAADAPASTAATSVPAPAPVGTAAPAPSPSATAAPSGTVAPPAAPPLRGVVLTDIAGAKVAMDSLLARGPVVLNFWATWCGPCRAEMPNLEKIFKEVGPKGVSFAAISLDRRVTKEAMVAFLKSKSFTVPVYRDDDAVLARIFKVSAIPATFVLKPTGEVFYQTKGYRPGDEILLKKKVEELVAAAKPAASKQE